MKNKNKKINEDMVEKMCKLVGRLEYDGEIIEEIELFGPGTYDEIIEERHKIRERELTNRYQGIKEIAKERGLEFEKIRMPLAIEEVEEIKEE